MGFSKNGLNFREVEPEDLPWLRDLRNDPKNAAGWRDPRSVQTFHNQEVWYQSLDAINQAFVAEFEQMKIGLLRFRLDYPMSIASMTGTDVVPDLQGHGYGKRILHSGAEYVINDLGFHRATAECMESNIGAARIIQAAGFKPEGILRGYIWRDGKYQNWHIFSVLRGEL